MPTEKLEPLEKLLDTEGTVQLSVAVGAVQFACAALPVVVKLMFWGQFAKTGGVTSLAHGSFATAVAPAKSRLIIFLEPVPLNVI